jgi:putative restriction endonuclease
MDRQATIPLILSKKEMFEVVLKNFREAGWNISRCSNINKSPLKVTLTSGDKAESLLIYIWNISHGGKSRSEDEYRIQIHGKSLEIGEDFKTLLLGYHTELNVFAAFNAFRHRRFGRSPSVQIKKSILQSAVEHGVAFQTKTNKKGQEIAIAFQPNHLIEYVTDIYPQYHKNGLGNISASEAKMIEKPLDIAIPAEELNKLPTQRRMVLKAIIKVIREAKFQKNIRFLYKGKCAICSLQARLTEAAHIIPVSDDGSDEIDNGILLCRNHHRAYDAGLIAINKDYVIVLNNKYAKHLEENGEGFKLKEFIEISRIGEKINLPDDKRYYPKKEFLAENCKSKGI